MLSREEILLLIENDKWMMEILENVKKLGLPDWWICAGFVRSKVWDVLHGFEERTPMPDVDVIYFDANNIDEVEEKRLEEKLRMMQPTIPWSVKNEARMHLKNGFPPYSSSVDAISKFPETATALGVKLDDSNNLLFALPVKWGSFSDPWGNQLGYFEYQDKVAEQDRIKTNIGNIEV